MEPDVRDIDPEPGHQARDARHVHEPLEDAVRARRHAHERQERERDPAPDRRERQPALRREREEPRRVPRERQPVQRPRGRVQVRRRGGPCGGEQRGVDHGGQALDPCAPDRDDEGRAERGAVVREVGVVGGYEEPDDERSRDVEEEDTDVHALDGLRDVTARVLRLTSSDGDDLRTDEGESCLGHDLPPAEETAFRPSDSKVLHKRTRVMPEPEPKTVVIRPTTQV